MTTTEKSIKWGWRSVAGEPIDDHTYWLQRVRLPEYNTVERPIYVRPKYSYIDFRREGTPGD